MKITQHEGLVDLMAAIPGEIHINVSKTAEGRFEISILANGDHPAHVVQLSAVTEHGTGILRMVVQHKKT